MEGQSDLPENALRSGGKRPRGSSASPTDERPPKRSRVEAAGGPDSESDYGSDFDEETIAQLDAAVEALSSANQKETAAQDDETDYGSDFDEETIAQLDVAIAKIKARRLPAADTDNRKRPRAGSLGAGSDEEGHRPVKRLRAAQAPVLESDDGSESELEIVAPQALPPAPPPRPRTPARPSGQNPAEEDAWRREHEGLLFVRRRPTEEERGRRKPVEVLTENQFRDRYKLEPNLGEAALARTPDGDYRLNGDHGAGSEALKNSRAELKSRALDEVGMFVRDHGRFRVIKPEDTLLMGNGLRDWTRTYGENNVWLKTRDGDFRTVENLHAMSLGSDGADRAYFSVNIRPLRRDLAQVFVQDDRKGERYVSLEKHSQRLAPGNHEVHPDVLRRYLSGRDAFVLSPDGWALMKPLDFEQFGWKPYLEAAMPDPNLRNALRGAQLIANGQPGSRAATTEPEIILAVDGDTLLRGKTARDHIRHQGLPPGMANLFYRTQSHLGDRGIFSCAGAPRERYGTTVKPDGQLLAELKIDAGSSRTNQRRQTAGAQAERSRDRYGTRGGYGM